MKTNPNFIKFYSHLSKQFSPSSTSSSAGAAFSNNHFPRISTTQNSKINSYVYTRLPKSCDLLAYVNNSRSVYGAKNPALEKQMRKHFARMHDALSALKKAGFSYTDFKPENVLVDQHQDLAYLIDLESVVSSSSKFVCLRTLAYTPPLYTRSGQLVDIDGLSQKAIYTFFHAGALADPFDRIMSWTFCVSLYVLMCYRPAELANYAKMARLHERFRYEVYKI